MRENGVSVPQLLCLKALNDFPPGQTPTVAVIAEELQLSSRLYQEFLIDWRSWSSSLVNATVSIVAASSSR